MAVADIINRTRSILYGTGLGEKPAIRQMAADPNGSLSGETATFDLASGEGDKVKPGQVLSVYEADADHFHAFYVLSVSTDTITVINGYGGSPAAASSSDLTPSQGEGLLEQNPLATTFEMDEAIDAIFAHYLYPEVYDITTATISSPDLTDGQEAVAAAALEIINAHQVIGSDIIPVSFTRFPQDVDTTLASTGKLATFDWVTSSTGYYTYKEKFAEADESGDELTHMVAVGAAALLLGAHVSETTIEATKKENAEAVGRRQTAGNTLWRDFLTLKQRHQEQLGRQGDANRILVSRG